MGYWEKKFGISSVHNNLIYGVISRNELLSVYDKIETDNLVVISISDMDIEPISAKYFEGYSDYLPISFNDRSDSPYVDDEKEPIDLETAKIIRNFILKNKDKKFLINCMVGHSRSPAVALAIECLVLFEGNSYDYQTCFSSDIKSHIRYKPNLTVFSKIINN